MPTRTRLTESEVKDLASVIVSRVVAEMMEHAGIKRAIDKVKRESWHETLDELARQTNELLLSSFGAIEE